MPSQFATAAAYSFSLLIRQGVSPKRILAVTLTKKAADEMRDRIARLLELPSASGLNIMTFHAFAFRLLKGNPGIADLPERFRLWDAAEQRHIFAARRMWWNEEQDILDIIGGAKERLLDAEAFGATIEADDNVMVEAAAAERGVGYGSSVPNALDDLVLANEPVPVLDQQDEQVEDLRLNGLNAVAAPHFVGVRIDQAITDPKNHRPALLAEHRLCGRRLSLGPSLYDQGLTPNIPFSPTRMQLRSKQASLAWHHLADNHKVCRAPVLRVDEALRITPYVVAAIAAVAASRRALVRCCVRSGQSGLVQNSLANHMRRPLLCPHVDRAARRHRDNAGPADQARWVDQAFSG